MAGIVVATEADPPHQAPAKLGSASAQAFSTLSSQPGGEGRVRRVFRRMPNVPCPSPSPFRLYLQPRNISVNRRIRRAQFRRCLGAGGLQPLEPGFLFGQLVDIAFVERARLIDAADVLADAGLVC